MEEIRLRPWAKINLYLEVLGKRDNGYHQIRTLIQPIALFDELILRRVPPFQGRTSQGLEFNCRIEDDLPGGENLPLPSENLVSKSARLFFSKIGEPPCIKINLVKHIPIGGGLGGGSSDAANTFVGLNQLWGYPLEDEVLSQLATQLGMDISSFLGSPKPTVCSGRGEIIEERWEDEGRPKFFCVLINPGKALSASFVYKEFSLPLTVSGSGDSISLRTFQKVRDLRFFKMSYNTINNIVNNIRNDLETTAIKLYPELYDIIETLRNAGVLKGFVCGSGSTVCGLVANRKEADEVVKRIEEKEESKKWWIRVVSTL